MSSRNSNLSDTRHYSTLLTWQSPVIFKMLSQICTQFDEIWALNKTWTNLFFPPNQVSKSWVDNHSRDIAILDDSAILWNPFLGSVLSNALESRCLITGQTCTIPATEYAILITGEFSSTPSAIMSHRVHIRNRLSKCSCDDFETQNSTEQLTVAIEGSETMGQRHNWKDRFVDRTTKPAEGSELKVLEKSNPSTYHRQTLLGVDPRIDWWIPQPPLSAICPPAELEKVSTRFREDHAKKENFVASANVPAERVCQTQRFRMRASSLSGRIYSTIVEDLVHMLKVACNVGRDKTA